MAKEKDSKQLAIQSQKLEEWQKKLESGEAFSETKNIIMRTSKDLYDPEHRLQEIAKTLIPKLRIKNDSLTEEESKLLSQAVMDLGFENGLSIMEGVEERYRGMMMGLKKEMIKEFDCKTYSEKALVDMAVCAYARNLTFSKRLQNTVSLGHTTAVINGFIAIMSKEIDRANRHFITALEVLKQFKQPELKVNVKTNNAFISQNQQFNNNQTKQDEAIEVK